MRRLRRRSSASTSQVRSSARAAWARSSVGAARPVTLVGFVGILVLLAITVSGCIGGNTQFPISDGRELLTKTMDRAIALERVHVDARLPEAGNTLGGPSQAALQADLDLKGAKASLTASSSEPGSQPVGVIVAEGGLFTSNGGAWQAVPIEAVGLGGILGAIPERSVVEGALRQLAADDRVVVELRDPVDCASGRCYSMVVTVPPEVLFQYVRPLLGEFGGGVLSLPETVPPDVPPLNLLLYVEPSKLDVEHAEVIFGPTSGGVHLFLEASRHDEPLDIQAPPNAIPVPSLGP